jgi:hypothetical protein
MTALLKLLMEEDPYCHAELPACRQMQGYSR